MLKDNWLERQLATVKELIEEGQAATEGNKLVEAESKLKEAAVILDSAETINLQVLRMRYVVFNELAVIAGRTGDAGTALSWYTKALRACETMEAEHNESQTMEMITVLINLGGVYAGVGRLGEGEKASLRALDLLDSLPEKGGEHGQLMRVFANYHLGAAIHSGPYPEDAYAPLSAAVDVSEMLPDEMKASAMPLIIECLARLADLASKKGEHAQAARTESQAAEMALDLHENSGEQAFLNNYANCMMRLIGHHERAGSFAEGEDIIFKLLELFPGHEDVKSRAEAFYTAILSLDDAALEAGDLPREEAVESLGEIRGS